MFARKSLLTLISNLIYYFVYGITLLFAVNKFLPSNFGYLKIATSLMGFFLFFSDLSFTILHSKMMAEDTEPQNDYFTTYFIIKIVLTIFSSFIIFGVIIFQINAKIIANNSLQIGIIAIMYFSSVIQSVNLLYRSSFAAKLQIARKEIAFISSKLIGSIYLLLVIFFSNNFLLYVSGTLFSESLFLILNIILGKDFRLTKIRRDMIYKYFSLGAILIIPAIILTFSTNLGPLLYKVYHKDDDILGVYDVITNFFIMISLLEGTIRVLLIPNYSSLITQKKFKELKNSIKAFEKYVTLLNSLIIIGGIISGPYLLKTFLGEFYYDNGIVLYFGGLIALFSFGVFVPYSSLIFASGKLKIYIFTHVFLLIFLLISWFLLIPPLGVIAIDLVKWIYWIPNAIVIRYYCVKYFNIGKMEKNNILNYLILLIFMISSFFLSIYIHDELIPIMISIVSFLSLYIIVLFVFKILNKQDLEFFREIFNPKKMFNYIKTEIKNNSEDQ